MWTRATVTGPTQANPGKRWIPKHFGMQRASPFRRRPLLFPPWLEADVRPYVGKLSFVPFQLQPLTMKPAQYHVGKNRTCTFYSDPPLTHSYLLGSQY